MGQVSAAANDDPQKKPASKEPEEQLATEFVLCPNGTIFWASAAGVEVPDRAIFEGWEMSWPEALQAAGQLPLVGLTGFGVGSDGSVYGNAERVAPDLREGRATFRGYALTDDEREIALGEFHRVAFNVTIAVHEELRQRRIAAQKAVKKAARDAKRAGKKAARAAAGGTAAPSRTRRRSCFPSVSLQDWKNSKKWATQTVSRKFFGGLSRFTTCS
jgi:hypothetical protein